MENADNLAYFHFTGPARLDKAVHTLEGLLKGISADRTVNTHEVHLLKEWMYEHREFANRHPFSEFFPVLAKALTDECIDQEEMEDLIWLCSRMTTGNTFYSDITSDIQRLHAIVAGIVADRVVTMEELEALNEWIEQHQHLRTCWPYDEIESLVLQVQKDRIIDAQEHALLLAFFSEFGATGSHRSVNAAIDQPSLVTGLCAVCPEVTFPDKTFCFTGKSKRASRTEIAATVTRHGGCCLGNVTLGTNYLVIGADGNPCWAFACYGRKVETAVEYRKRGNNIVFVHEHDFWDAVADAPSA